MADTFYLYPTQVLTVTANASSTGTLRRLSDLPGGGADLGSAVIAASTVTTYGPYSGITRWALDSTAGLLSYVIAAPSTEADVIIGGVLSGPGAAAGTGVSATERSSAVRRTDITLAGVSITMTDATTAGSQGSLKVYDFPGGPIQILGASFNLTTLAGAGGIADNAALVGSLGSVTVGTDNATLTSTEADIIASTTGTLSGGAGTLKKHGSVVSTAFDGTTTPADVFLNLAVPDAGTSANDTITVSGTITLTWINLGDY